MSYLIEEKIEPVIPTNESVKPYKCLRPNCKASFNQRGNMLRHIAEVHEGKRRSDSNVIIIKDEPEDEENIKDHKTEGKDRTIDSDFVYLFICTIRLKILFSL